MQYNNQAGVQTGAPETPGQYLTIWLAEQLYAFPVQDVVQIVGVPTIVRVPEFPHYAKGVANLRGEIFPIVDLRLRLDLGEEQYTDRTCVIITSIRGYTIGFVVDSVEEVVTIDEANMRPVPNMDGKVNRYVDGVCEYEGRLLLRFAMETLLSAGELDSLTRR